MGEATTECPIPGCQTRHRRNLMMCATHWRMVPKLLQQEVYRAYRQDGVMSEAYLEARKSAIEAATP